MVGTKNHVVLVILILLLNNLMQYFSLNLVQNAANRVIQEAPGLFVSMNKIKTVRKTCQVVRFWGDALTLMPISRIAPDCQLNACNEFWN